MDETRGGFGWDGDGGGADGGADVQKSLASLSSMPGFSSPYPPTIPRAAVITKSLDASMLFGLAPGFDVSYLVLKDQVSESVPVQLCYSELTEPIVPRLARNFSLSLAGALLGLVCY